jgi:hypothetical protein
VYNAKLTTVYVPCMAQGSTMRKTINFYTNSAVLGFLRDIRRISVLRYLRKLQSKRSLKLFLQKVYWRFWKPLFSFCVCLWSLKATYGESFSASSIFPKCAEHLWKFNTLTFSLKEVTQILKLSSVKNALYMRLYGYTSYRCSCPAELETPLFSLLIFLTIKSA